MNGGIILKAFIYDMDGVIADTEPVHMKAEQHVMKKMGVELELAYFQRYQGMTDVMILKTFGSNFASSPLQRSSQRRRLIFSTRSCMRHMSRRLRAAWN